MNKTSNHQGIYPFKSDYVRLEGYDIHFVETGKGDPVLFVHGNPTSSYTFRDILKPIADQTGRRCIAIDLIGFGKSDKPNLDYSCEFHASILSGFIESLDLTNLIVVAEDWGGFLAGYVMTKDPSRYQSAVMMETFLWSMTWEEDFDPTFKRPFKLMRTPLGKVFTQGMNILVNKIIPEHCPISDESLQYYRNSTPTYKSRKAIGDFPKLIPINGLPKASQDFADRLEAGLHKLTFPFVWFVANPGVIISELNPIGLGRLESLKEHLPQLQIREFGPGHHYLSEENPARVVEMVVSWVSELQSLSLSE